ncbi:hypothetical protein RJZ56_002571 [Blastomyces dermatitidis]
MMDMATIVAEEITRTTSPTMMVNPTMLKTTPGITLGVISMSTIPFPTTNLFIALMGRRRVMDTKTRKGILRRSLTSTLTKQPIPQTVPVMEDCTKKQSLVTGVLRVPVVARSLDAGAFRDTETLLSL